MLGKRAVDPLLGGLLVLEINDLRFRDAALLEKIDERVVAPVLDRERAVRLGMFPAQNADDEDPCFRWLPVEVFGGDNPRKELNKQKNE